MKRRSPPAATERYGVAWHPDSVGIATSALSAAWFQCLVGGHRRLCPAGIDVYFKRMGGKVFDAVLPQRNTRARMPVCGLVSQYIATRLPESPDRMGHLMGQIQRKRITMRGSRCPSP